MPPSLDSRTIPMRRRRSPSSERPQPQRESANPAQVRGACLQSWAPGVADSARDSEDTSTVARISLIAGARKAPYGSGFRALLRRLREHRILHRRSRDRRERNAMLFSTDLMTLRMSRDLYASSRRAQISRDTDVSNPLAPPASQQNRWRLENPNRRLSRSNFTF